MQRRAMCVCVCAAVEGGKRRGSERIRYGGAGRLVVPFNLKYSSRGSHYTTCGVLLLTAFGSCDASEDGFIARELVTMLFGLARCA